SARDSGLVAEAKSCLDRALEEFPRDPEILADLASLQLDGGDWHGALTSKEALLNRAEGSEARDLLLEIGDIYRDKVSDASRAEGAYRRALTFVEDDHVLLHRLLDLYSESSQWEKTVEVCERLAGRRDEAPRVRAKYLGVAASLYDKHLDRPDEALRFYNRVLDVDPDELKAFSAIDAICTRLKDWRTLEQNYGKMLKRLPAEGKTELKVMLWHNLGEVLRSRRRDFEGAIAAFEVAYKLDPKDIQRRRILGELYRNAGSSYVDRAIGLYQTFVNDDPQQGESCRILRTLHFDAGHYDRAWGLSGVLIFIDQADREIVDFYRHYRRRSIPRARARLLDDHWPRYLYHPTQDPYVSAVFSILAGPMAAMTARSHAQFSLKRKDCYDYEGQQEHPFGRLFAYVQGVLHAPAFDLFLDPEKPASLQLAHTTEATSLVAGANILRGERPEKELAFLVGKQLALLRPDLFLRVALPARGQLQGAFVAARRLVDPSLPLPRGEEKAIIKGVERLRKQLSYPQIEQLGQILSRIEDPDRVDLRKWWDAVELTTDRVAMLLCNDLGVAGKMIAAEPSAVGLNPRARVDELVRFAASDAYYHLRKDLGITIEETV
ncbi:MAG: hypothetical protein KAI47_11720, partial [Deltaproteobacteria bacterium]|nr:hypothetical protein [Deltaproteobacteria bacterium]